MDKSFYLSTEQRNVEYKNFQIKISFHKNKYVYTGHTLYTTFTQILQL